MAAYTVVELSRQEQINPSGVTITRILDVSPYSARGTAYEDLIGGVRLIGGRLVRFAPLAEPSFPWARVCDIQCDPISDDDYLVGPSSNYNPLQIAAPYHGAARLRVTYKTPEGGEDETDIEESEGEGTEEQQEIDLANGSWDFGVQNISLPNESMGWQNKVDPGHAPVELLQNQGISATKTLPRIEFALERKFVIRKPLNAILKLLGRVNKSQLRVGGDLYPAETVRFDSAMARRRLTSQGIKHYELTLKFAINPLFDTCWKGPGENDTEQTYVGWNRLYNPRAGHWMKAVLHKDPTRTIYQIDEDITQTIRGRTVKGLPLLFHPGSS